MSTLLDEIIEANREHLAGAPVPRPRSLGEKALLVVCCADPRLTTLLPRCMGVAPEEMVQVRNAGNHVGPEALRTVAAMLVLGRADEVFLIGHTDCLMRTSTSMSFLDGLRKRGMDRSAFQGGDVREWFGGIASERAQALEGARELRKSPFLPADTLVHALLVETSSGKLEVLERGSAPSELGRPAPPGVLERPPGPGLLDRPTGPRTLERPSGPRPLARPDGPSPLQRPGGPTPLEQRPPPPVRERPEPSPPPAPPRKSEPPKLAKFDSLSPPPTPPVLQPVEEPLRLARKISPRPPPPPRSPRPGQREAAGQGFTPPPPPPERELDEPPPLDTEEEPRADSPFERAEDVLRRLMKRRGK